MKGAFGRIVNEFNRIQIGRIGWEVHNIESKFYGFISNEPAPVRCKIINYYYRGLIICIGRLNVFEKTSYRRCFRILDKILDTISFDRIESDGICFKLGCIFDRANHLEAPDPDCISRILRSGFIHKTDSDFFAVDSSLFKQ